MYVRFRTSCRICPSSIAATLELSDIKKVTLKFQDFGVTFL